MKEIRELKLEFKDGKIIAITASLIIDGIRHTGSIPINETVFVRILETETLEDK
jgi:hypothetical protein